MASSGLSATMASCHRRRGGWLAAAVALALMVAGAIATHTQPPTLPPAGLTNGPTHQPSVSSSPPPSPEPTSNPSPVPTPAPSTVAPTVAVHATTRGGCRCRAAWVPQQTLAISLLGAVPGSSACRAIQRVQNCGMLEPCNADGCNALWNTWCEIEEGCRPDPAPLALGDWDWKFDYCSNSSNSAEHRASSTVAPPESCARELRLSGAGAPDEGTSRGVQTGKDGIRGRPMQVAVDTTYTGPAVPPPPPPPQPPQPPPLPPPPPPTVLRTSAMVASHTLTNAEWRLVTALLWMPTSSLWQPYLAVDITQMSVLAQDSIRGKILYDLDAKGIPLGNIRSVENVPGTNTLTFSIKRMYHAYMVTLLRKSIAFVHHGQSYTIAAATEVDEHFGFNEHTARANNFNNRADDDDNDNDAAVAESKSLAGRQIVAESSGEGDGFSSTSVVVAVAVASAMLMFVIAFTTFNYKQKGTLTAYQQQHTRAWQRHEQGLEQPRRRFAHPSYPNNDVTIAVPKSMGPETRAAARNLVQSSPFATGAFLMTSPTSVLSAEYARMSAAGNSFSSRSQREADEMYASCASVVAGERLQAALEHEGMSIYDNMSPETSTNPKPSSPYANSNEVVVSADSSDDDEGNTSRVSSRLTSDPQPTETFEDFYQRVVDGTVMNQASPTAVTLGLSGDRLEKMVSPQSDADADIYDMASPTVLSPALRAARLERMASPSPATNRTSIDDDGNNDESIDATSTMKVDAIYAVASPTCRSAALSPLAKTEN